MLSKVTLVIILVIVGIICDDSEDKTFQKNGVTFKVNGNHFIVKGAYIPVLRRGLIADIEEVRRLHLMYSNISTIEPGAFGNLPNLRDLNIVYNKDLKRIEVGVFNDLNNLTGLSLSENGLEYIAPHAFDNMTNLGFISISSNKLKIWDTQWFAKTPSVHFFFVDHNLFTKIPANAFGETRKRREDIYISYINFRGNPINQIDDDAFKSFEVVTHLEIDINSIDILEGNFLQGTHFREIDFAINDNNKCLDEKYFSKIFVANSTKLESYGFDRNCKNKINEWAAIHEKKVNVWLTNYP